MMWPSKQWWQPSGFDVDGTDDEFTVHIPAHIWSLVTVIALLLIGAIAKAVIWVFSA